MKLARHSLNDVTCLLRLALIYSGNCYSAIIFDINFGSGFCDPLIVFPPGPMIIPINSGSILIVKRRGQKVKSRCAVCQLPEAFF
jgi:hypothetical protein